MALSNSDMKVNKMSHYIPKNKKDEKDILDLLDIDSFEFSINNSTKIRVKDGILGLDSGISEYEPHLILSLSQKMLL